jgi:hypothetical protein
MSDRDKLGGKCAGRICPCPEDGLVITAVAIGVLNRRLGFADTPQANDTLWLGQGCGVIYLKCPTEGGEHSFRYRFLSEIMRQRVCVRVLGVSARVCAPAHAGGKASAAFAAT